MILKWVIGNSGEVHGHSQIFQLEFQLKKCKHQPAQRLPQDRHRQRAGGCDFLVLPLPQTTRTDVPETVWVGKGSS